MILQQRGGDFNHYAFGEWSVVRSSHKGKPSHVDSSGKWICTKTSHDQLRHIKKHRDTSDDPTDQFEGIVSAPQTNISDDRITSLSYGNCCWSWRDFNDANMITWLKSFDLPVESQRATNELFTSFRLKIKTVNITLGRTVLREPSSLLWCKITITAEDGSQWFHISPMEADWFIWQASDTITYSNGHLLKAEQNLKFSETNLALDGLCYIVDNRSTIDYMVLTSTDEPPQKLTIFEKYHSMEIGLYFDSR